MSEIRIHQLNKLQVGYRDPPDSDYCNHPRIAVSEKDRIVVCDSCGSTVEAFDWLLDKAKEGYRMNEELAKLKTAVSKYRERAGLMAKLNKELSKTKVVSATRVRSGWYELVLGCGHSEEWFSLTKTPPRSITCKKCVNMEPVE